MHVPHYRIINLPPGIYYAHPYHRIVNLPPGGDCAYSFYRVDVDSCCVTVSLMSSQSRRI